jgi:GNAT superfamily N-acetyltransferase
MQIKEIKTTEQIAATFDVLNQIYEDLNQQNYIENIQKMMQSGYKMAGVFADKSCIGVVGIRITYKLQFGKSLEIEDFMIDRSNRGIGVGKMLMRFVDWQAMEFDCTNIIGTLQTKRQESQKIFAREKFLLDGLFFKKTNN